MNFITKVEGIRYINKLLHEKIRDFSSYNKIVRDKFNIYANVPIYIDDKIVLLPIKRFNSYDCVWINYINIENYIETENKIIIKFKDGERKAFDINVKKLERIIKNALIIIDYFKKMYE